MDVLVKVRAKVGKPEGEERQPRYWKVVLLAEAPIPIKPMDDTGVAELVGVIAAKEDADGEKCTSELEGEADCATSW